MAVYYRCCRSVGFGPGRTYLFPATVGRQGAVGCAAQGCPVVAEIPCWVHLVLEGDMDTAGRLCLGTASVAWSPNNFAYLEDEKLSCLHFGPGLLQPGDRAHVHAS